MQELLQSLQQAGADVQAAVERFGGNEALYMKFVGKFPADMNYQNLISSLEKGDMENLHACAHTLKGVSANLGFTRLSEACAAMVSQLRGGKAQDLPKTAADITAAYEDLVKIIG